MAGGVGLFYLFNSLCCRSAGRVLWSWTFNICFHQHPDITGSCWMLHPDGVNF
eukprot:gnl/Chilomastix_caulleri/1430.p1 GENE.gnl/Chilomastix_caulleri/1430~~gnl/Chilomastix_caulleri/1430.p1  ORF type:complete len:53 (-),score=9.23 gnl/Chilomastix_caulleri/1430:27-185(-)